MTARRFAIVFAGVFSLVLVTGLSARPAERAQQPQGDRAAPGQTAGQRFKNIQVLKDVPAEQWLLTMQYVASSLGVQCNYCHVQGANERDDKETKKTARQMMKMVNALNESQFEGRAVLSCASCHNGRAKPLRTPPLASEMTPEDAARSREGRGRGAGPGGRGAQPEPAAPQKPAETVEQVTGKYLEALGGRQALENAKTRVMTGTVTTRDLQSLPVTVLERSTGAYRIDIASQPSPTIRAFNGTSGWSAGGFQNQVRDLEGFQLQQGLRLADLGLPLRLSGRYDGLAVTRYADVDGKAAIVLSGRPYAEVTEQLFFDRETGLLLRRTVATRTGLGELPEQIDYSDYRDVSGVKMPFTVRHVTWNAVTTERFTDVKINVPVSDDQFARPPAKPQGPAL